MVKDGAKVKSYNSALFESFLPFITPSSTRWRARLTTDMMFATSGEVLGPLLRPPARKQ